MSKNHKIELDLTEVNSNAFAVMGAFSKAARRQGWTPGDIKEVLDEAKSGDYNHLLQTIISNIL